MRFFILCTYVLTRVSLACTTLYSGGYVAKSYDWGQEHAKVIWNRAGIKKTSLKLKPTDVEIDWVSRYASLTFNQYGQEFPNAGMNAMGLVVEIMVLADTIYPTEDNRGSVNELQWVQYQLDHFAYVKDAIANLDQLRISKVYANVHYLMCDSLGDCATIEFLDGKSIVHTGTKLKVAALANNTYAESLRYIEGFLGFGGNRALPLQSASSLGRFTVAASQGASLDGKPIANVFSVLENVKNGDYTKWQIVYDIGLRRVSFRTLSESRIKTIELNALSDDCSKGALAIDITAPMEGDVTTSLLPFSTTDNKDLVENTLRELQLPEALIRKAADYPSSTVCR